MFNLRKKPLLHRAIVVLCTLFVSIGAMSAQEITVTGKVIDAKGEPVVGVYVLVQGTSRATSADFDGKYSINVAPDGVLVFTSMGYLEQTIPVNRRAIINVTMEEDAFTLDDVVVVAMGIRREAKAMGYASQSVSSNLLTQAANTNFATAVQGKISGVQITSSSGMPGASSLMVIRGARSLTGNNTPLYVVDGMPVTTTADVGTGYSVSGSDYANRSMDIDPNDIESINILKGQAASALYGQRASNGVIMITTKSGKGLAKGQTMITVNSTVSFDKMSRKPEVQTTYAQGDLAMRDGVRQPVFSPTSSSAWGPKISDLAKDPVYGYGGSYPGGSPGQYYVPQRAQAGLDPWAYPAAYDNIGDFFNTGVTFNNSVNIARASQEGHFSLSVGSTNQEGIVPNTYMDRYNAKLTSEVNLSKTWKAGFTGTLVTSEMNKSTGANDGIMAVVYNAPTSYDLAGIPYHIEGDPTTYLQYRGGSFDAAYWSVENNKYMENTDRFFGNAYVTFNPDFGNPAHKLNVKLQIGADMYATLYENINAYGTKGGTTGSAWEATSSQRNYNFLLTADYNWIINPDWRLDVVLGGEYINENNKWTEMTGTGFLFKGWNHINNTGSSTTYESNVNFLSAGAFGSAMLTWKNQLYLTVTGRGDRISSMPRDNRTYFYPSVSLSYVLTEIPALKNDVLTFAKIRGSFAQVGQPGTYLRPAYGTVSYGGGFYMGSNLPVRYPYNGLNGYRPATTRYDSGLKPQNTTSYEVGADLYFWDGLLRFNYTFSDQTVRDQIFTVPLAGSTGVSGLSMNAGHVHTTTHEATVSVDVPISSNFDWNTSFNFTKIHNMVLELAEGVESIMLGGFTTPQVRAAAGDTYPTIYGVAAKRNDEGYMIVDSRGIPSAGETRVLGRVSPDFNLSANTALRYKSLILSAVFEWQKGGVMYAGSAYMIDGYGVGKQSEIDREQGITFMAEQNGVVKEVYVDPKDVRDYYTARGNIAEFATMGRDFVKLREVSLNYGFKIKKVNVGVNVFARNILLWAKIPYFDPEFSQGNNSMSGAFERFSLPATSSYGLGINVRF